MGMIDELIKSLQSNKGKHKGAMSSVRTHKEIE